MQLSLAAKHLFISFFNMLHVNYLPNYSKGFVSIRKHRWVAPLVLPAAVLLHELLPVWVVKAQRGLIAGLMVHHVVKLAAVDWASDLHGFSVLKIVVEIKHIVLYCCCQVLRQFSLL